MKNSQIIDIVDQLVFNQTQKHLDNIQQSVIIGVWEGKSYFAIAKEYHCSESYVRDSAYKLWKILSQQVGEKISKANFRCTLERLYLDSDNSYSIFNDHSPNFSTKIINSQQINQDRIINPSKVIDDQDSSTSHIYVRIFGYDTERELLSSAIKKNQSQLITISGLTGVGKTILVKHFVDLNRDDFQEIIWKSLQEPLLLNDLLDHLFKNLQIPQLSNNYYGNKIEFFLDILKRVKCLIIFDDLQNLFKTKELAGEYQPEYLDYQKLFKMVAETKHQSHLILISQEKIPSLNHHNFNHHNSSSYSLELTGFNHNALEIFKGLSYNDKADLIKLINYYNGNPIFLDSIITLIHDIFNSNVNLFLAENELFLTEEIIFIFTDIFNRLSEIEQEIVLFLSQENKLISKQKIQEELTLLSNLQIINALQSLERRFLLLKRQNTVTYFGLDSLFKQYLLQQEKNRL
jgi:hypothetical protein